MKLSKQERIAVLVILVLIILGLGIFLLIVPKFQAIGEDSATLESKQSELVQAQERAATKNPLREDIVKAYNEGKNKADTFFEEMTAYEADNEIREFLDYCNKNDVNVFVDSLTVGEPSVSTLAVQFFEEPQVNYALKDAVNGSTKELTDEQKRQQILQGALSRTQDVGSIEVSFKAYTLGYDEMMKFIDTINDYKKDSVRKTLMLTSGVDIEHLGIIEKYDEIIAEKEIDVQLEALNLLAKKLNKKAPTKADLFGEKGDNAQQGAAGDNAGGNQQQKEDLLTVEDIVNSGTVTTLDVTLTIYSLERMQDPAATLKAQEEQ